MDGAHDMGGMHGFGPVVAGAERAGVSRRLGAARLRATLAMGMPGGWNIDMSRFARENRPPGEYLTHELLPDLARRPGDSCWSSAAWSTPTRSRPATRCGRPKPVQRAAHAAATSPRCCTAAARPSATAKHRPRSRPGDRVRAKNIHPPTHTRLPRYVRGHVGIIERVHRLSRVSRQQRARRAAKTRSGSTPCVSTAANCGAPDGDPTVKVSVDAWEPYLEPA